MNNFVPNFNFGGYNQPYNMYPFNNNYNTFQQMQQNQQNQTQQQTIPTNTNKIFVNGIEDVKNRQLPFNSDYMFLDNDKPVIYQKTVDSKGQFEVKAFEIHEIKPQERQKEDNSINLSNYVTLTEFDALKGQIDELKNKITKLSVQNELNSLSSELKHVEGNNE